MALSEDQLRSLLISPRETLDVELKRWINPAMDEGKAKMAKGCMALRNNNGGFLLIGFDDDGTPDRGNAPSDIRKTFHGDVIQAIVGQFSSELFPVEVQFGELDGAVYPVICVPSGVRTPVAAKRSLGPQDKPLLKDHAVYVRSLTSNNTVSSSEARRGDWDRLVQICLDNREADIGAFVRRHLTGINLDQLGALFTGMIHTPPASAKDRARGTLDRGRERFIAAMSTRGVVVPQVGFREAAVAIEGEVPEQAQTESFLQKLFVAQPRHTGWPAWVDSRRLHQEADRPTVLDEGWEALLADSAGYGPIRVPHLDFWRIEPKGDFYLLTALEDDMRLPGPRPEPLTLLDFQLQIGRVAQIISVALSFGRSMGCEPSKTSLSFSFRWSRLTGRRLTSWVEPIRGSFHSGSPARQDEVVTAVTVPLDTPRSAIGSHVEAAVRNLFAVFGGMEYPSHIVQEIVDDALQIRF